MPDAETRTIEVQGGTIDVAQRRTPIDNPNGDFPPEFVEAALWEIAVAGGNCARARRELDHRYPDEKALAAAGIERLPSDRALRYWKRSMYRDRYHEILQTRAKDLEEIVAQNGIELALNAQQVKLEAMKQVAARIGATDAVEASTILRNLAQAEAGSVQMSGQIRNRPGFGDKDTRSLQQIAKALERLGVASVEGDAEDIEDADVVATPPGELPAGPAAPAA